MKPRNSNLDALRAVAVLMVLGRHFECFPLWTKIGWAGVDLFFVLSGFLISGLLFGEWKERGSIGISRFYIRRGLKIYPAFWALLAATIAITRIWPMITPHPVNHSTILAELLFIQNYFGGIWGHTWSLAVEEHFYIVLPLILWMMQRRHSSDPFRILPGLFLAIAATVLILRILPGSEHNYATYLVPTHLRIDSLLFGVLLGYYRHFHPATFSKIGSSIIGSCLIGLSFALLVFVPLENPITHTIGFTVMFLGFGFLLAKVIDYAPGRIGSALIKPFAAIGTYSYSIYLWHVGLSRVVPQTGMVSFFVYVALSIAIGILMATIIECPVLALRDRFFPSRRTASERIAVSTRPDASPGVSSVAPIEIA